MTIRLLLVLTILLSAATRCLADHSPGGSGETVCAGLIGGGPAVTTINGNVTVPDGKSCTLSFVNINGNVRVASGAALTVLAYMEPSSIGGNIEAANCNSVLLQGNVTV